MRLQNSCFLTTKKILQGDCLGVISQESLSHSLPTVLLLHPNLLIRIRIDLDTMTQ
jgi:hypothetical protein